MIDLGIAELYIDVDTYGYSLCRKIKVKDKKTGEVKDGTKNISYHAHLEGAIAEAINVIQKERLQKGDCSLKDAMNIMIDAKREVMNKIKEIGGLLNG